MQEKYRFVFQQIPKDFGEFGVIRQVEAKANKSKAGGFDVGIKETIQMSLRIGRSYIFKKGGYSMISILNVASALDLIYPWKAFSKGLCLLESALPFLI